VQDDGDGTTFARAVRVNLVEDAGEMRASVRQDDLAGRHVGHGDELRRAERARTRPDLVVNTLKRTTTSSMSLELVKGQWQPHQAAYPPQGSAVAPAPQPVSLRPVSSSPSEDYAWRCRVRLLCLSNLLWHRRAYRRSSLIERDARSPSASHPSHSPHGSSSCSA
jgi:hypothetical protein